MGWELARGCLVTCRTIFEFWPFLLLFYVSSACFGRSNVDSTMVVRLHVLCVLLSAIDWCFLLIGGRYKLRVGVVDLIHTFRTSV